MFHPFKQVIEREIASDWIAAAVIILTRHLVKPDCKFEPRKAEILTKYLEFIRSTHNEVKKIPNEILQGLTYYKRKCQQQQ